MISPPYFSANSKANFDFPVPVAPHTTITGKREFKSPMVALTNPGAAILNLKNDQNKTLFQKNNRRTPSAQLPLQTAPRLYHLNIFNMHISLFVCKTLRPVSHNRNALKEKNRSKMCLLNVKGNRGIFVQARRGRTTRVTPLSHATKKQKKNTPVEEAPVKPTFIESYYNCSYQ
ncbi:hypothetical protein OUZ56_009041 [Daphnia magna]|uniref:Uncharacterized protein n=1 Tax=Daphnia magna TaxID=35525 RepID=A0ABR0AEU5_9CRUS|nr:hypothetical protein OUZ56_009041 [Daphnia magna]